MVHPFFQQIRDIVRPNLDEHFVKRFEVIFLNDNENVDSWLDVIANHFPDYMVDNGEIQQALVDNNSFQSEKELLQQSGFTEDINNWQGGFRFWVLIRFIHQRLQKEGYNRDDNIFEFMKHQHVKKVRVVLMGQDPRHDSPSPGFAFHLDPCFSTEKILSFLSNEMNFISKDQPESVQSLLRVDLNQLAACNLSGWVEQNVLMLNCFLTFHDDKICLENSGWELITNFFVSHISDTAKSNTNHLAFLLAGSYAQQKWNLIDTYHLKMQLYHPSFYSKPDYLGNFSQDKDWGTKLPFINTNLYLYQMHNLGENVMIDWVRIREGSPASENEIRDVMVRLFSEVVAHAKGQAENVWTMRGTVSWRGFQVRRATSNQYFYLERR